MIEEQIKIPTDGKPVEAFALHAEEKPPQAFLVIPGRGYTINHFLLDYLWKMAAEAGFYALKAEYRGYTYRHLGQSYEPRSAAQDLRYMLGYLAGIGYQPAVVTVCAKSLGTIALADLVCEFKVSFPKTVLLTPVLYVKKGAPLLECWGEFNNRIADSYLVFGDQDPYCDLATAKSLFPKSTTIDCYPGADHGLSLAGDYRQTIRVNVEIIEKVKQFLGK